MRILSLRRLGLSLALGLVLPLGYAFLLSFVFDFLKKPTPQFLVWPFGWPRPLWILLIGHQPSEADLISGIVFVALCNVLLYGSIVYLALSVVSQTKKKPVAGEPPPPPNLF
jgi:hypothetical protein